MSKSVIYEKIIRKEVENCSDCPAFSCEDGGICGDYYFCNEIQKEVRRKGIDKRCPMKPTESSTND